MSKEQILLRMTEDLNARIEAEAGSKRERAEWIRELIRDELGASTESEPDTGHYPEKDRDRKVYESLLEHGSHDVLKEYVRLDDIQPEIAQDAQVGIDAIYKSLKRMERHRHVRLDHGMYEGDAVRVRARPPQADPELWVRAKDRNREMNPDVLSSQSSPSSARDRLIRDLEEDADDELEQLTSAKPEVPADD